MKKSLIALAALAASGFAMAQSSVTLFGVVDAAVTVYDGAETTTGLGNSGNSSSRLGFRGVEDLGNGLKASFHLEGALATDNGTGTGGGSGSDATVAQYGGFQFMRRSTLSLHGGFGELRLGRNLTSAYSATSRYDNFGTVGVGGSSVWGQIGGVRRDNMITYQSNDFGGFKFAADYALGETTGANVPNGNYWGAAATYDNGPLSLGVSYFDQTRATIAGQDRDGWSVGGSFNFGAVKLAGAFQNAELAAPGAAKAESNNYLVALSAPVGAAGEAKLSYNRYENESASNVKTKADHFSLGYVHSLSKRTAVYGTYSYLKNKNNGTAFTLGGAGMVDAAKTVDAGGKIQALQIGVRHNF
jgi:predicted porin